MPILHICPDCNHGCTSLAECLRYQDFNLIVENAQAVSKLKKQIGKTCPEYKGKNPNWFKNEPVLPSMSFDDYKTMPASNFGGRFATITFDPKKFSANELTNPKALTNFIANALLDLKPFYSKCYLVYELTKHGIVHAHINYTCDTVLDHTTFMLRLKYYFAKDLRNKHCIHDRMFNDGGIIYMVKPESKLFKEIFIL